MNMLHTNLNKALRQRGLALAAALALGAAAGSALAQASVAEPWARSTSAGQRAGGAFLTLKGGAQGDRLLGGTTAAAERLELHTMSMDGNVMRMRQLDGVDIPAGQTVTLAPGGQHVMLMGLKEPLKAGTTVPVTLNFEKAGAVQVQLEVRDRAAAQPASAPGGQAGGHSHHRH